MTRTPYHREPPRVAFLAAVLARALPDAAPYRIAQAVDAMIHAAKAHKRAGEHACSYPMTEAQEVRTAKRLGRLASKAYDAILSAQDDCAPWTGAYGINVMNHGRTLRLAFGGDPRGPCGRLIISDMPGDGFGEGFALYD